MGGRTPLPLNRVVASVAGAIVIFELVCFVVQLAKCVFYWNSSTGLMRVWVVVAVVVE